MPDSVSRSNAHFTSEQSGNNSFAVFGPCLVVKAILVVNKVVIIRSPCLAVCHDFLAVIDDSRFRRPTLIENHGLQ